MAMRPVFSCTNPAVEACLSLANKLILTRELPIPKVSKLKDIDSHLITFLFENICGNSVPDQLSFSDSVHEAHNVQAVIDTLSLDILGISLSHITGEDVVAGDADAIFNLLEVFEGLVLFISPELCRLESQSNNGAVSSNTNRTSVKTRDTKECSINEIANNKGLDHSLKNVKKKSSLQSLSYPTIEDAAVVPQIEIDKQKAKEEFAGVGIRLKSASNQASETTLSNEMLGAENLQASLEQHTSDDKLVFPFSAVIFKGDENEEPKFKKLTSVTRKVRKRNAGSTNKENVSNDDSKTYPATQFSKEIIDNGAIQEEGITQVKTLVKPPLRRIVRKRRALKSTSAATVKITVNKEGVTVIDHSSVPEVSDRQFKDSKHPHIEIEHDIFNEGATETRFIVDLTPKKFIRRRKPPIKSLSVNRVKSDENQVIEDKYEDNLGNRMKKFLVQHDYYKHRASQIKVAYSNAIKKPLRKPITPLCEKSFLLPTNLRRRRSTSFTSSKRFHTRGRSSKPINSVNKQDRAGLKQEQPAFLKKLQEDFPCASVSPHTERVMTNKNENHLLTMHKRIKTSLLQKPRTQIQLEEATKRQNVLSDIMKKEIHNCQHLKRLQEDKTSERKVGYSMRDARLRSARLKKYFNDYHEDMKKKLQSRNIAEEQLLKKVHEEALNIEKEQVQVLTKRAKEMDKQDAAHNKKYLEALENFYESQFALLSESLAAEKKDLNERSKAQKRVLQLMERDMRKKLESEVTDLQQQVVDSQRDIHFRELDAEMYLDDQRDRCSAAIP